MKLIKTLIASLVTSFFINLPVGASNIKFYCTNSPNIIELVYFTDVLLTPEIIKEFSAGTSPPKVPTVPEMVKFRRSGANMVVEQVPASNPKKALICGRYEGTYWKIQDNKLYSYGTDHDALYIQSVIAVSQKVAAFNLPQEGAAHIQWKGSSFSGKTPAGKHFSGDVVGIDGGLASAVELQLPGTAWPHIYEYKYLSVAINGLFPSFPTTMNGSVVLPGKGKTPVIRVNVQTFIPTNGILPGELIDPAQIATRFKPISRTILRSNDVLYAMHNGKWVSAGTAPRAQQPNRFTARIFMVSSLLAGLATLAFLVRIVRGKNSEKTTKILAVILGSAITTLACVISGGDIWCIAPSDTCAPESPSTCCLGTIKDGCGVADDCNWLVDEGLLYPSGSSAKNCDSAYTSYFACFSWTGSDNCEKTTSNCAPVLCPQGGGS